MSRATHSSALRRALAGGLLILCLALAAPLIVAAAPPREEAPPADEVHAAGATLSLGTYLGGRSADVIKGVAADSSGIYVVGETYSDNLAGFGGRLRGQSDLFVAKLRPGGNGLLWGVYLGGAAGETAGGIALDGRGGVWVVGSSTSGDFPTTSDALQGANNGGYDAIVAELDARTGAFRYGTYYGEGATDEARGIAADGRGSLLITGAGGGDVMALKIEAASHNVVYAGYFGGSGEDGGHAVAAGPNGYAFVTGVTDGPGSTVDFPLIKALQSNCGLATEAGSCGEDAFVTAISPDGALVYSTLLGGGYAGDDLSSGGDVGKAIAVDAQGHIYVAGETYAADFPTRSPAQAAKSGAGNFADGFVAKIAPDGASLVFATYLGGTFHDEIRALRLDGQGNAYVAGLTGSANFPVREAFQGRIGPGVCQLGGVERPCTDAVVAKLTPAGALAWSTFLGGGLDDGGYGLALDGAGGLLVSGAAASSAGQGFPITGGAYQPTKGLSSDGFVVRLGGGAPPSPPPADRPYRVGLPLVTR